MTGDRMSVYSKSTDPSKTLNYASSSYAPVGLTSVKSSSSSGAKVEKAKTKRVGGGKIWEDRTLDEWDESTSLCNF